MFIVVLLRFLQLVLLASLQLDWEILMVRSQAWFQLFRPSPRWGAYSVCSTNTRGRNLWLENRPYKGCPLYLWFLFAFTAYTASPELEKSLIDPVRWKVENPNTSPHSCEMGGLIPALPSSQTFLQVASSDRCDWIFKLQSNQKTLIEYKSPMKTRTLFCPLEYFQALEQCLELSRCSNNIW